MQSPPQTPPNNILLDGWAIAVDWKKLYYTSSFFVPSVNWRYDKKVLQASADAAGCEVGIKGVVEEGVRGLRVWCLKPCSI